MHCIVTAGPSFESLDEVRRLTNFSTGRLGTELACYLAAAGHRPMLLRGELSAWPAASAIEAGIPLIPFRSAAHLRDCLASRAGPEVGAVFHAAAVGDFAFGRVWRREAGGGLVEVKGGKLSTHHGTLLAELVPTEKIITTLRDWFPQAWLVGWKYEVDGGRDEALERARAQLRECRTDVCVVNGPAYGPGFGLLRADGCSAHAEDQPQLFAALVQAL